MNEIEITIPMKSRSVAM